MTDTSEPQAKNNASPLSLLSKVKANPDCLSSSDEEDTALLDSERKLYFGLEGVASFIWEQIKEEKSLGSLVKAIVEEYDISEEAAEKDCIEFIETLSAKNLIITS